MDNDQKVFSLSHYLNYHQQSFLPATFKNHGVLSIPFLESIKFENNGACFVLSIKFLKTFIYKTNTYLQSCFFNYSCHHIYSHIFWHFLKFGYEIDWGVNELPEKKILSKTTLYKWNDGGVGKQ